MFAKLGDIYNYLFIITSLFFVVFFWFLAFDIIHQLFYNILFLHLLTTVMFLWGSCYEFCPIFNSTIYLYLKKMFLAFDFCRFCVVIRFFSSLPQRPLWPQTSKDFPPQIFIHYIYFPILFLQKEPVFPFLMFSAKQGNYWYHFYNVFGMTRSWTGDWTRDLPTLEASTLPLFTTQTYCWRSLKRIILKN